MILFRDEAGAVPTALEYGVTGCDNVPGSSSKSSTGSKTTGVSKSRFQAGATHG